MIIIILISVVTIRVLIISYFIAIIILLSAIIFDYKHIGFQSTTSFSLYIQIIRILTATTIACSLFITTADIPKRLNSS